MATRQYNRDVTAVSARATLSSAEVCEMFNIPRSTLHRWLKAGKIPEPAMNPSSKQLVWTQTEINAISRFLVRGTAE
jgi:predicted site-specific integrase-resolvase